MRVIITGSRGFIGKNLCLRLKKEGIEYKSIDLPMYNICDDKSVEFIFKNFDTTNIVHLAAISHVPSTRVYPYTTVKVNVMGLVNMLQYCRFNKVERFIYLSSPAALSPVNVYGTTKLAAELLCRAYWRDYHVNTTTLRVASVYGKGDKHKRVVDKFVERAVKGEPLTIEGDGSTQREFTYVEDAVEGIVCALKTENEIAGKTFNVTGGRLYSMKELVETIKKELPKTKVVYKEGRKVERKTVKLDLEESKKVLGYEPKWSLEAGIKEMIQWKSSSTV